MEKITRREFIGLAIKTFLALILIKLDSFDFASAKNLSWDKKSNESNKEHRFVIKEKSFILSDLYEKHFLAG